MKIAIISDNHLEAKPYNLTEKQQDIYNTFIEAIRIIKKESPDLVIIAGDLFDNKKPSFLSYYYANFLSIFSDKIFFIEGNHDSGVSEFFKALGVEKKESISLKNNLYIAGIDYYHNHNVIREKIKEIKSKINPRETILVLHANLLEAMPFLKEEDKYISIKDIKDFKFCIIAHFHNPNLIENKFLIPGSLERLDITNQDERKLWFLDINEFNEIKPYYHIIPTRKIIQTDNKEEIIKILRIEKLKPIVFYTGKPEDIKPSELILFERKCLLFKIKRKVEETIDDLLNTEIQITRENLEDMILNFLNQFEIDKDLKEIFMKNFGNIDIAEKELERWINDFETDRNQQII